MQQSNMQANHNYILSEVLDKIPTLFIRYEDLVGDPASCLTDVIKFSFNIDSIEGTVIEKKILQVAKETQSNSNLFC